MFLSIILSVRTFWTFGKFDKRTMGQHLRAIKREKGKNDQRELSLYYYEWKIKFWSNFSSSMRTRVVRWTNLEARCRESILDLQFWTKVAMSLGNFTSRVYIFYIYDSIPTFILRPSYHLIDLNLYLRGKRNHNRSASLVSVIEILITRSCLIPYLIWIRLPLFLIHHCFITPP